MKKIITVMLLCSVAVLVSYTDSLLDVNYDPPKSTVYENHDMEALRSFYNLSAEAERSAKKAGQEKEAQPYQAELDKMRSAEKADYEAALQKLKTELEASYQAELQKLDAAHKTALQAAKDAEKQTYQAELEKMKNAEKASYETTIAKLKTEQEQSYQVELKKAETANKAALQKAIEEARIKVYSEERSKISEQVQEDMKAEITETVTAQLIPEYEQKKNGELASLGKELEQRIYIETNAGTARFKAVAFNAMLCIVVLIVVVNIFKYVKSNQTLRRKRAGYREYYFHRMGELKGQSDQIREEIDAAYIDIDLRVEALNWARESYQVHKDYPMKDLLKDMENLAQYPQHIFNIWNNVAPSPDKDNIRMEQYNKLRELYTNFHKKIEAFVRRASKSPNGEAEEIIGGIQAYGRFLNRLARDIRALLPSTAENPELARNLTEIAADYETLAKQCKNCKKEER
ncbi:hypothetical protein ACFGOO_06355 [Treponema vincentii]|uniref:hypothetical protein n=1 Tax=Treponema vincentii TaxID=69710 RepID=UPI0035F5E442